MVFDSISSNIDEILSINPSVNVFVFGDSNVHHKDWLTYSSGTDRPGELCYNFYISNDLTQMVNFPTRIPDCDSHWEILIVLLPQFLFTFQLIANSVLNKGKSAIPPLFNGPEVLSSASDKAKLFAENFSLNSNLDDSGISLPVFPSRTNLKLHNISLTPKMVKKVVMNLDLTKASGPDCISVVVLKNCEPELSYILAELFKSVLRSLVFQIVGRLHLRSLYLRMLGKGLLLKSTTLLVFFLWLVKSLRSL